MVGIIGIYEEKRKEMEAQQMELDQMKRENEKLQAQTIRGGISQVFASKREAQALKEL